jgi:hypothetical protein
MPMYSTDGGVTLEGDSTIPPKSQLKMRGTIRIRTSDMSDGPQSCPIGLDASPQFCSVGSCDVCVADLAKNGLRRVDGELVPLEE